MGKSFELENNFCQYYLMSSLCFVLADRSIRPLFPAGYFYDTQVGSALGLFVSTSIKTNLRNLYNTS